MMQARSELTPMTMTRVAAPVPATVERTIEVGSSPWVFAWAAISFAAVLGCVIYLSAVSF